MSRERWYVDRKGHRRQRARAAAEGNPEQGAVTDDKEWRSTQLRRIAAIVCFFAVICGVPAGYLGVEAFKEPTPFETDSYAQVEIMGNAQQPVAFEIASINNTTTYTLGFTADEAGEKYALLLAGTATIGTPDYPCTDLEERSRKHSLDCQLFQGTVPGNSGFVPTLTALGFDDACTQGFSSVKVVSTLGFQGKSHILHSDDWAYSSGIAPRLDNQEPSAIDEEASRNNPGFSGFPLADVSGCVDLGTSSKYQVANTSPPATYQDDDSTVWAIGTDDDVAHQVIYQKRSALFLANAGIVIAGLSVAILGGFLPVLVQESLGRPLPFAMRQFYGVSLFFQVFLALVVVVGIFSLYYEFLTP